MEGQPAFLAHLRTTCSRGVLGLSGVRRVSSVLRQASSTISLSIFSSQTDRLIWTKLDRNIPWEVLFKNCSQNLIPSKTVVAIATKWIFFKQFFINFLLWNRWSDFEIISRECFQVTQFKNCSQSFDPSINMALVNGSFLHYTDIFFETARPILKYFHRNFPLVTLFKNCFEKNLIRQ